MHDVIIIGGGPAGLSAAIVLGRCRRDVLLLDAGCPRNRASRGIRNFITRDGIRPAHFLKDGRREAARYGVRIVDASASDASAGKEGFTVRYGTHTAQSRKLLLTTGIRDELPAIPGLTPLYGKSVHHCPYCDGYEHRDQRLAAYGKGDHAVGLALNLRTWSKHVTACTDGEKPSKAMIALASRNGIGIRTLPVARLVGGARLRAVQFTDGTSLRADAVFFNTGQSQRSDIPRLLGCAFKDDGGVETSDRQCTNIPGLYLAGDADRDVQFVVVAAAEGATAAVAINHELQNEDRGIKAPRPKRASRASAPRVKARARRAVQSGR